MSQTRFVRSHDGTSIACQVMGEGPTLVILHGALNSGTDWRPVAKLLASRFTVFLPDRRGRGESGDHPDYALAREVEDLMAVLEIAGSDAVVLAHSFGAVVALETALVTPMAALIVYEPPLHAVGDVADRERMARYAALIEAGQPEAAIELFLVEGTGMPTQALPFVKSSNAWPGMLATASALVRESVALQNLGDPDRYRALTTPLTVLVGGATSPALAQAAEGLAARVPGARLRVLDGQGHAAHRMAPDLVARAVEAI